MSQYAHYPIIEATIGGSIAVSNFPATQNVAGTGTAGTAATGVVTVQGIAGGTAIPVSGSFSNAAVGTTGAAVPGSADYIGINVGGNLTGATGTANGLKVDGSAVTQPVSGVFWQATQPVSGTVGISGSVAVTGTFWQATQPVSLAAAVATNGDGSVSGGSAGSKSILSGGVYNSSTPTLTNGQQASLQLNASGALLTSAGSPTTSAATFQDGSIAFGSLTTSYATVLATGGVLKHVDMRNNTNAVVLVSLNGGSTLSYTLDPGDSVSLDLAVNGSNIASSTNLQAKYSGTAPTAGSIRINGWY